MPQHVTSCYRIFFKCGSFGRKIRIELNSNYAFYANLTALLYSVQFFSLELLNALHISTKTFFSSFLTFILLYSLQFFSLEPFNALHISTCLPGTLLSSFYTFLYPQPYPARLIPSSPHLSSPATLFSPSLLLLQARAV